MKDITLTPFTACLMAITLLIFAQLAPVVLFLRVVIVGGQDELPADAKRGSPRFISGAELRSFLPTALLFFALFAAGFGLHHFDATIPGVGR